SLRPQRGKSGRDEKRKLSVSLPEGALYLGRRIRPGEDESQVTRTFRQRHKLLTGLGGDDYVFDMRGGARFFDAFHAAVNARFGDGNHQDAARWIGAFQARDIVANRVPRHKLLERHGPAE